jgi:Lrp/AsnC family leucine-responsive transcriptional regulator
MYWHTITGNYAILLETVFESTQKLDAFIQRLQEFGDTQTDIVFLTSSEHRQVLFPIELNDDEKQTDTLKK